jgi:hypothetical protein
MSDTVLLWTVFMFQEAKRKTLMSVKGIMEFKWGFRPVPQNTRIAITYNISIICFFILMSYQNLQLEPENKPLKRATFIFLSMHIMLQQWLKLCWKRQSPLPPSPKAYLYLWKNLNVISFRTTADTLRTLVHIHVPVVLIAKGKISIYVNLTLSLILSFSRPSNERGEIFKTTGKSRFFEYKMLCLILNFLCSTAHKVTWHSMVIQQTGPILRWTNYSKYRVSSG